MRRYCIGYGDKPDCQNETGAYSKTGRRNDYWCPECDEKRITAISASLDAISKRFAEAPDDRA